MSSPVVTVRGAATHEVPPELAAVSAAVGATGSTSEQVATALAAGGERLSEVIERFADAVERSATSGIWIHPVTDRRHPTKITGYRGSFGREIVVHDFARLSDLVLSLSGIPQTELGGPWWSLRPDSPVHRDVRLAAIADGRRRAEDYAEAFGARVTELLEVSDLAGGMGAPMARQMMFAEAKGGAPEASFDFEPQLQRVTGEVTLRFAITSPVLTE